MDKKIIIVNLLTNGKRYWGKALYEQYESLFQEIHSSPLLAEMISKDLGYELKDYQIQFVRTKYHKTASQTSQNIQKSKPVLDENWGQKLYDEIYNKPKKSEFDLGDL